MRAVVAIIGTGLFVASPVAAQMQMPGGLSDPRQQLVDFHDGEVVQLHGVPGYQMMVELSPDEQIQNVAVGDPSAWQVSANKDGDRLFVKPIQAGAMTNMTVVTSVRTYLFDLSASEGGAMNAPYTVQFRYPGAPVIAKDSEYVDVSAVARRLSRYRISGDRLIRPNSVSDDGQHTYISWPRTAPIPAVYAPSRSGNEQLLNGMMGTDDVYVVDGAPQSLIFRLDNSVARADRIVPRRRS